MTTLLQVLPLDAAELSTIVYVDMRDSALDDMRQQLEEARTDRDRAQARCRELEMRLNVIREACR